MILKKFILHVLIFLNRSGNFTSEFLVLRHNLLSFVLYIFKNFCRLLLTYFLVCGVQKLWGKTISSLFEYLEIRLHLLLPDSVGGSVQSSDIFQKFTSCLCSTKKKKKKTQPTQNSKGSYTKGGLGFLIGQLEI